MTTRSKSLPARHIFLCGDEDEAKCASRDELRAAWRHLKRSLKAEGLAGAGGIRRTRTACLRVCEGGPVAVVYPEGAWYTGCDREGLDRIIREHLVEGRIVDDLLVERAPLTGQRPERE